MSYDSEASQQEKNRRPWGLWATIGFSFIVLLVYWFVQVLISFFFIIFSKTDDFEATSENLVQSLSNNGLLISLATIGSALVGTGLTYWFVKMRKNFPVEDYLSLKKPATKDTLKWLLVIFLFVVISDLMTYGLQRQIVPKFIIEAYKTADSLALLYFAIVVAAPIFEELFFRGFLFQGIRSSLGDVGAVAISALSWAIVHIQYDAYQMFIIAIAGVLIGWARMKTRSIYVPIAMHSFNNAIAIIETIIYFHFFY